ncbi:CACNA1I [Symbiodinium natans]|uniref:CACNA1I protein n=1 Tax=Symbiodinium natans TaxID=878477 RepID=A0A812T177_9DINO|nr:CACNA1I [Symbiodinium natans]
MAFDHPTAPSCSPPTWGLNVAEDHEATDCRPSICTPMAEVIREKLPGHDPSDDQSHLRRMSSRQRRHMRWKNAEQNVNFMSKSQLGKIMSEASWAERMVRSKCFEWFSGSLILFNCIFIGWHTQMLASHAIEQTNLNMDPIVKTSAEVLILQVGFTMCFLVELLVRWKAEGLTDFFRSSDVVWNILDIVCVLIGIVDASAEIAMLVNGLEEQTPLRGFTVMRVLRVVRIVRVVRVIRIMRFFRELRMMIFSTVNSLKSVVWVILFLFGLFYMFGVAFTSAVVSYLDTLEMRKQSESATLQLHFGTLDVSILTLYMAMSGGQNWHVYYDSLATMKGGEFWCLLYILYITFAMFAVVNIVTGVFVDTALQSSKNDREVVVQEELEQKHDYLRQLHQLFQAIDENSEGRITREVLQQAFKHETILAFFSHLKIDVPDATTLFDLLDFDQSGAIDLEEFLHGCYQLHGEATHLEAKMMQAEVRFMKENLVSLVEDMRKVHAQLLFLKRLP